MIVKVNNQAEMEAALKDPNAEVWLLGNGVYTVTGSQSVTASGSASVTASGSASVRAWGSASVTASDSASVTATTQVPVLIMSTKVKADGGVQINYKTPTTATEWLANYGVKPARGIAILYKGVNDEYKSEYGGVYTPGTKPVAKDWDGGKEECGGGFHFSPHPALTLKFAPNAKRFVACPIKVSEIAVHKDARYPDKIKAPRVYGEIYEVDINGERITKE